MSPVCADMISATIELNEQEARLLGGSTLDGGERDQANSSAYGDFFNVQVLHKLLSNCNLNAVRVSSPDGRSALSDVRREQGAFILNSGEHWWTVRLIDCGNGSLSFFDCNSLKPAPEEISDSCLETQIAQLVFDGGNVFAIRGSLPHSHAASIPRDMLPQPAEGGHWLTLNEARKLNADAYAAQVRGRSLQAIEDIMAKGGSSGSIKLGASESTSDTRRASDAQQLPHLQSGTDEDPDTDLQAAIQASLTSGQEMQQQHSENDELAKALQMSMEQNDTLANK